MRGNLLQTACFKCDGQASHEARLVQCQWGRGNTYHLRVLEEGLPMVRSATRLRYYKPVKLQEVPSKQRAGARFRYC
jgi:hypothetical protein